PGLEAILTKMMAKRPEQRYQIPNDVVEALEPWTRTPIPPPPESEMPHLSPALVNNTLERTPAPGQYETRASAPGSSGQLGAGAPPPPRSGPQTAALSSRAGSQKPPSSSSPPPPSPPRSGPQSPAPARASAQGSHPARGSAQGTKPPARPS